MPLVTHLTTLPGSGQEVPRVGPSAKALGLASEAVRGLRGVYLHVPFCFHKCHYCDFYSLVDSRDRQTQFVHRLITEIRAVGDLIEGPLETIFVGGGTPTLLPPEPWEAILEALRTSLPLGPDGEFTVEANPETVTPELAAVLAAGGVNRVSIGAQSFDYSHLKTLERWHEPENVARAATCFRDAGIANVNLDLIFSIPGQSVTDVRADLDAALAIEPDHLSYYGLMYEPNTPLTARLRAGTVERLDDALEASMYETILDRLDDAGFEHYEISNWAKPGRACRHNLLYWSGAGWWPLGPSAAGYADGVRWANVRRLDAYLEHGPLPPIHQVDRLDDAARVGETLMLRLRLREGLHRRELDDTLARAEVTADARREAIQRHVQSGLLEWRDDHLRLSRRGLLLADVVLVDLL